MIGTSRLRGTTTDVRRPTIDVLCVQRDQRPRHNQQTRSRRRRVIQKENTLDYETDTKEWQKDTVNIEKGVWEQSCRKSSGERRKSKSKSEARETTVDTESDKNLSDQGT